MSVRSLPKPIRPPCLVPTAPLRPVRPIMRPVPAVRHPRLDPEIAPGFGEPEPFEDYRRSLTPEGGILIFYKDLDLRWRQYVWRILAWSAFTGAEGWYLAHHSPVSHGWTNLLAFLAVGIVNWLIVRKPSECHRRIEVRPDCLIVEGTDVFWRRYMDTEPPGLQPDGKGNQRLCGIYGTRMVEFLTVRRFDEFDRTSEVIGTHLADAFEQIWSPS